MFVKQLYTNCLAHAAYYVESNGEALIIDPLRDVEPYIELARERGARIRYILETHFHADFVSGHLELARQTGAVIVYGDGARPDYPALVGRDGDVLTLGKAQLKILHTPGHTLESCCFLLYDEAGKPNALFTGDTLFVGDVGRPDLLSGNLSKEELASKLFDSLNNKLKKLPDDLILYPGHGPGSACGKNIGKETVSTLGEQKKTNYALREENREEFIKVITSGLTPPPSYFFKDAGINIHGYEPLDKVMERALRPVKLHTALLAQREGAVILDTRPAEEFSKGYFPGAINIGLNGDFAVWTGTLIPFGSRILLYTEKGAEKESAVRLARIGYDSIEGYLEPLVFDEAKWHVKMLDPSEAMRLVVSPGYTLLDVRRPAEVSRKRLKHALNIPLSELPSRLEQLNRRNEIIVCCAGGYRSMIAASLLKANGFIQVSNVRGGVQEVEQKLPEMLEIGVDQH